MEGGLRVAATGTGATFGGRGPGKKGRRARVGPVHWPPRVQATPEDSVAASPLMKRLVEMIIL
jgi:hypothetical protein